MESENRSIKTVLSLTWNDLRARINELNLDPKLKYYGVPRGGQPIAAFLNPVDTPKEADIIIDDIVDSGATRDFFTGLYPDKPFIALYDQTSDPTLRPFWLQFPWEEQEAPAEDNFRRILQAIGEDPNREGLQDTPKRYLKFLKEFLNPPDFKFTTFHAEDMDQMIVQDNIPFYSFCEHHIAPFFGTAVIAYLPGEKIVGLSKLARTLELYSRRLQNQERITSQVAERLMEELDAKGVAVSLKAQHLCMAMRGVRKHDTWTTTTKLVGQFKDDEKVKDEFLRFVK